MESKNEIKDTNDQSRGRQTRRFEFSIPIAQAKVLDAAATLGGYESTEAYIIEAAAQRAGQFQEKFQAFMGREVSNGKSRKIQKASNVES